MIKLTKKHVVGLVAIGITLFVTLLICGISLIVFLTSNQGDIFKKTDKSSNYYIGKYFLIEQEYNADTEKFVSVSSTNDWFTLEPKQASTNIPTNYWLKSFKNGRMISGSFLISDGVITTQNLKNADNFQTYKMYKNLNTLHVYRIDSESEERYVGKYITESNEVTTAVSNTETDHTKPDGSDTYGKYYATHSNLVWYELKSGGAWNGSNNVFGTYTILGTSITMKTTSVSGIPDMTGTLANGKLIFKSGNTTVICEK